MKNHIKKYKEELEKSIGEYMERPATERSAEAIDGMTECWMHLDKAEKMLYGKEKEYGGMFTHEDAKHWANKLINDDGTTGAHWTIEQTSNVAKSVGVKFEHITDWCWWIAMNMIYSDYSTVADKYGVGTPEFYADLTKAFLFDKDGASPEKKLTEYYNYIVCWDHEK